MNRISDGVPVASGSCNLQWVIFSHCIPLGDNVLGVAKGCEIWEGILCYLCGKPEPAFWIKFYFIFSMHSSCHLFSPPFCRKWAIDYHCGSLCNVKPVIHQPSISFILCPPQIHIYRCLKYLTTVLAMILVTSHIGNKGQTWNPRNITGSVHFFVEPLWTVIISAGPWIGRDHWMEVGVKKHLQLEIYQCAVLGPEVLYPRILKKSASKIVKVNKTNCWCCGGVKLVLIFQNFLDLGKSPLDCKVADVTPSF